MLLEFETLKDKILGCWNGKNAGGVLGAPFEGKRQINNVSFYTQDINENPPANDDLDLQLVWLNAIEKFGRAVDSSILGEFWVSYIIPNWAEYGMGKSNLSGGLMPPLSGYVNNHYKDSCGCFIRSEIWACIMPGHPERAVRYAFEDAIVDHADEGLYAEIFCTALESAAFVENDVFKLIDIALSYIPEDCGIAKAAKIAVECYKNGKTWQQAREMILTELPATFGINETKPSKINDALPVGKAGYDAPSNIGITLIGLLYGEGDFGDSICIAVNCGEDTDCSAATLGSILGIIHGNSKLPEKWLKPLGGVINTICINKCACLRIPADVEELTERVLRQIPIFLEAEYCDFMYGGNGFILNTAEELMCEKEDLYIEGCFVSQPMLVHELLETSPFMVKRNCGTVNVWIDYMGKPFIKAGETKKVRLLITRSNVIDHQQFLNIKLYMQPGVTVAQGRYVSVALQEGYGAKAEIYLDITAETIEEPKVEILADISVAGRHTDNIIKILLFPEA